MYLAHIHMEQILNILFKLKTKTSEEELGIDSELSKLAAKTTVL